MLLKIIRPRGITRYKQNTRDRHITRLGLNASNIMQYFATKKIKVISSKAQLSFDLNANYCSLKVTRTYILGAQFCNSRLR